MWWWNDAFLSSLTSHQSSTLMKPRISAFFFCSLYLVLIPWRLNRNLLARGVFLTELDFNGWTCVRKIKISTGVMTFSMTLLLLSGTMDLLMVTVMATIVTSIMLEVVLWNDMHVFTEKTMKNEIVFLMYMILVLQMHHIRMRRTCILLHWHMICTTHQ